MFYCQSASADSPTDDADANTHDFLSRLKGAWVELLVRRGNCSRPVGTSVCLTSTTANCKGDR